MLSLNLQGEGICRVRKDTVPYKVNLLNICNHHEIVKRHFHFYISFIVMLKIFYITIIMSIITNVKTLHMDFELICDCRLLKI